MELCKNCIIKRCDAYSLYSLTTKCSNFTPKKRCSNCKHSGGYLSGKNPCLHCHADVGGYTHWEWDRKDKEEKKQMTKKIELTEDQFDYLCDEFFPVDKEMREQIRQQMKDQAVLPADPVEEAEELYRKVIIPFAIDLTDTVVVKEVLQERLDCIHKLYEALQYKGTKK